ATEGPTPAGINQDGIRAFVRRQQSVFESQTSEICQARIDGIFHEGLCQIGVEEEIGNIAGLGNSREPEGRHKRAVAGYAVAVRPGSVLEDTVERANGIGTGWRWKDRD